jgi:two-component system, NarL family, nitrate/nitrite sensor histidine kinase NarX
MPVPQPAVLNKRMRISQLPATDAALQPVPGAGLLAEITADLASGHDLADLLRRFLEPVVQLAGAQAGAVRALSDDGLALRLIGQVGLPERVAGHEQVVNSQCGVCGEATWAHRSAWSADMQACNAHCGSDGDGSFFGGGCRRVLAVPLQRRDRVLGVYNLFFGPGIEPSTEVQTMLRAIGDLLGLAMDNARLERENLQAMIVAERQAMAAEVHDAVAQSLAYIKMRMPLLQAAIEVCDQPRAAAYVDDVRRATTEAHASLREVLTHLRAPAPQRGLLPALADLADHFPDRFGLPLRYQNQAPRLSLSAEQEAQAFHIVQEALANVARHAQARNAWLTVAVQRGEISFTIDDDGQGADWTHVPGPNDDVGHHGLQIMRERARRLGGHLDIGPRAEGGTRVHLGFPAPQAAR